MACGSQARQLPPSASLLHAPAEPARRRAFESLVPALDALFTQSLQTNHLPGLGIGIVLDGEIVYLRGFGVQNLETAAPFASDSVFRIASVTKSLTALAILKLRDEGRLALDEPAARYYAPLSRLVYPTADSPPISVRQLLTHGSGLPEDNYWVDGAGTISEDKLVHLIGDGLRFSRAPGSRYEYSNTGYALLGQIIEHVSGVPARDYIERELLRPLGMTDSVWSPQEVAAAQLVVGYRGEAGYLSADQTRQIAAKEPLGVYDTAGGLYASLRDMTKYVAFQLSAWPPRDDPERGPVRRSSLREMQQGSRRAPPNAFPSTMLPSRRPAAVRGMGSEPRLFTLAYGYGFFDTSSCDDDFYVHHDGQLPGYTTGMTLYPARGYGIVMFANDERLETWPLDEATKLLREAGVIEPLPGPRVPALDAARAQVEALLAAWDAERARALFDPAFFRYQSLEKLQEQLAQLQRAHGLCRGGEPITVENLTRGSWRLPCERGEISFAAALSPEAKPRLQVLLWEDTLPPTAVLEQRAGEVLSALNTGGDLELPGSRQRLALAAARHGSCSMAYPLHSDGAGTASFELACEHGAAELRLTVDPQSGKLTSASVLPIRTDENCAP